jgi:hypothetical protein
VDRRRPRIGTQLALLDDDVSGGRREGTGAAGQKYAGLGDGKDWNGGAHGLGCKIGKLLEQIVFWGRKYFYSTPNNFI